MYELAVFLNAKFLELILDEVLHSLYIMVGNLLNILNLLCILAREVLVDGPQFCKICCRETLQLLQRKLAKGNEILNFNPYPIFYKSVLRKVLAQIFNLFAVSSIYWRYCH